MGDLSEALIELRRMFNDARALGLADTPHARAMVDYLNFSCVAAVALEQEIELLRSIVGACQPIDSLSAALRTLDVKQPVADLPRRVEEALYPHGRPTAEQRAAVLLRRAQARGA